MKDGDYSISGSMSAINWSTSKASVPSDLPGCRASRARVGSSTIPSCVGVGRSRSESSRVSAGCRRLRQSRPHRATRVRVRTTRHAMPAARPPRAMPSNARRWCAQAEQATRVRARPRLLWFPLVRRLLHSDRGRIGGILAELLEVAIGAAGCVECTNGRSYGWFLAAVSVHVRHERSGNAQRLAAFDARIAALEPQVERQRRLISGNQSGFSHVPANAWRPCPRYPCACEPRPFRDCHARSC